MERKFPQYKKIDMDNWPRQEHFQYYRNIVKCGYSLTARIDVTRLVKFARTQGVRFYGCFLFAAARTVNGMDEMKMMLGPDGAPGVWKTVHPNFTVFHQDDKTFSDLWTEYQDGFSEFYQEFEEVLRRYGSNHGVKARPDQPTNFFCVSCVPWLEYTGFATHSVGEPALFPIITFGRYRQEGERYALPVTLTISHAAADGYHTSQFFQRLQENIDQFPGA